MKTLREAAERIISSYEEAGMQPENSTDNAVMLAVDYLRKADAIDAVVTAFRHRQSIVANGRSQFAKENGRDGSSPWSELMNAIAVLATKGTP